MFTKLWPLILLFAFVGCSNAKDSSNLSNDSLDKLVDSIGRVIKQVDSNLSVNTERLDSILYTKRKADSLRLLRLLDSSETMNTDSLINRLRKNK